MSKLKIKNGKWKITGKSLAVVFSFLILNFQFLIRPAGAAVEYVVGRDGNPMDEDTAEAGRQKDLFYIYGGYNFHFANDLPWAKVEKSRWNLVGGLGVQLTDNFRLELAYEEIGDEYAFGDESLIVDLADTTGRFGFLNFIFDARLLESHRMFKTSPFVPFVGFGLGLGGFGFDDGTKLKKDMSVAYDFIGGVDIEINRTISLTLSYRYIKVLPNDLILTDVTDSSGNNPTIGDFAPSSHNIGLSAKMKF